MYTPRVECGYTIFEAAELTYLQLDGSSESTFWGKMSQSLQF